MLGTPVYVGQLASVENGVRASPRVYGRGCLVDGWRLLQRGPVVLAFHICRGLSGSIAGSGRFGAHVSLPVTSSPTQGAHSVQGHPHPDSRNTVLLYGELPKTFNLIFFLFFFFYVLGELIKP